MSSWHPRSNGRFHSSGSSCALHWSACRGRTPRRLSWDPRNGRRSSRCIPCAHRSTAVQPRSRSTTVRRRPRTCPQRRRRTACAVRSRVVPRRTRCRWSLFRLICSPGRTPCTQSVYSRFLLGSAVPRRSSCSRLRSPCNTCPGRSPPPQRGAPSLRSRAAAALALVRAASLLCRSPALEPAVEPRTLDYCTRCLAGARRSSGRCRVAVRSLAAVCEVCRQMWRRRGQGWSRVDRPACVSLRARVGNWYCHSAFDGAQARVLEPEAQGGVAACGKALDLPNLRATLHKMIKMRGPLDRQDSESRRLRLASGGRADASGSRC
jgi:hypothetical protein